MFIKQLSCFSQHAKAVAGDDEFIRNAVSRPSRRLFDDHGSVAQSISADGCHVASIAFKRRLQEATMKVKKKKEGNGLTSEIKLWYVL